MSAHPTDPRAVVDAFLGAFAAMNDSKITVWRESFDLATATKIHTASDA